MKIHIITGQTGTGKTVRAVQLAETAQADIINADARQIYNGVTIVSGKDCGNSPFTAVHTITNATIGYHTIIYHNNPVRIWLYDIIEPTQSFSSFDYATCARWVLNHLAEQGRNAIIVGGSYFYLSSLFYTTRTHAIPQDHQLRNELEPLPSEQLFTILQQESPHIAETLNNSERNNHQRLIRKIEIGRAYGGDYVHTPYEYAIHHHVPVKTQDIHWEGYTFASEEYKLQAITKRVEQRIGSGAIDEVQALIQQQIPNSAPVFQTIGCKEILQYIQKELSLDEAIQLWTLHEIQYTKRQLTFMKKDPHIFWQKSFEQ